MIAGAIFALRRAIRAALIADPALVALLGGTKIYDEAPRGIEPPWIAFADVRSRDWSTSTDHGAEHIVSLDAWSVQHGAREALEIAERLAAVLEASPLLMTGHRLVSLALQATDTKRDGNGRMLRARQTFRIVTERI